MWPSAHVLQVRQGPGSYRSMYLSLEASTPRCQRCLLDDVASRLAGRSCTKELPTTGAFCTFPSSTSTPLPPHLPSLPPLTSLEVVACDWLPLLPSVRAAAAPTLRGGRGRGPPGSSSEEEEDTVLRARERRMAATRESERLLLLQEVMRERTSLYHMEPICCDCMAWHQSRPVRSTWVLQTPNPKP